MPAIIHITATDSVGRKVEIQIEGHANQYTAGIKSEAIEAFDAAAKQVGLGADAKPTTTIKES